MSYFFFTAQAKNLIENHVNWYPFCLNPIQSNKLFCIPSTPVCSHQNVFSIISASQVKFMSLLSQNWSCLVQFCPSSTRLNPDPPKKKKARFPGVAPIWKSRQNWPLLECLSIVCITACLKDTRTKRLHAVWLSISERPQHNVTVIKQHVFAILQFVARKPCKDGLFMLVAIDTHFLSHFLFVTVCE